MILDLRTVKNGVIRGSGLLRVYTGEMVKMGNINGQVNLGDRKLFNRTMWSRASNVVKLISSTSNRHYAYFAGYPKTAKISEVENKDNGLVTPEEKINLKIIKELDSERKKHPFVIKSNQEEQAKIKVCGYLTHAPKAPKNEGGQKYIEISNPIDSEPQYLNPIKPTFVQSDFIEISHEIAADNSSAEAIIDKEIKKYEKI